MKILLLFLFAMRLFGIDITLYPQEPQNGKTLLMVLPKKEGVIYKKVIFKKHKYPIVSLREGEARYVFIPFSYYEKPGEKELTLYYIKDKKLKKVSLKVQLKAGKYKKESIKVASSKVNPKSKRVKERISKEYAEAMKIYRHITPEFYVNKPFILPLNSKITSDFGRARIYNGSLKGYHGGTDFRAKKPTPIIAANDGVVVLVKDRFYSGGTVVIDHGEGVYSCYFHLSKFFVKKNQKVKQGQTVALSGATGRITGPHLHFGIRVNGTQVDPLQFISLSNRILKEENK
jgi:murein DD-endopeptidase MepM/ murein hydrolase activator NlpD